MFKKIEYVNGLLFSENCKKVVLINKNRPAWQKGKWNGVGGKIEDFESTIDAMIREFYEETDLMITNWECFSTVESDTWKVYMYRAISKEYDKVITKTDEKVDIFNVNNLPENIVENIKWLIPLSIDPDSLQSNIVSANITYDN